MKMIVCSNLFIHFILFIILVFESSLSGFSSFDSFYLDITIFFVILRPYRYIGSFDTTIPRFYCSLGTRAPLYRGSTVVKILILYLYLSKPGEKTTKEIHELRVI